MAKSKISQGRWTRIRPLQRDELDPYTRAGMMTGELTWGGAPNNLCKVMAYLPRMLQTEVEYCNTFIFDPPTFRGEVQEAGFNDRFIKELAITKTSLVNRARYSITHHSTIGMNLFKEAGRGEEGHKKYLHLHEHEKHPDLYTKREMAVLTYAEKVAKDAHSVSDEEFQQLRAVLREHNAADPTAKKLTGDAADRYVDAQIVELTWLIGHFCLLNRWFSVLQVPDEGPQDENNFGAGYEQVVPKDVRDRNDKVLAGDF
jgi:alkylhydroperoxidase family enzyme